ncbi:YHYH protein, partial [bacterium]|nr:YHYH protein [bacterium]
GGGQPTPPGGGDNMQPTPPNGGGEQPTPPHGGGGGQQPTPPSGSGGQQPPGGNQPPASAASIQALRQGFAAKTSMLAHQQMHENGLPHSHVPAQMGGDEKILGEYHYHQQPPLLREQLGDDGSKHSPILGFAADGIPIYGPYGYENADGSGGVVRMESSYMKRAISQRTTLPDGAQLTPAQYGPDVSDDYPLGYFAEDYEYLVGLGHLDQYNGRFAVTPEYPNGVYAYYTTIDENGESAFPYVLAYSYYGQPLQQNLQRDPLTVPDGLQQYNPSPGSAVNEWLMME